MSRLNREELLAQLWSLKGMDMEYAHTEADAALLNYIGDTEVTEAFDAIDKWYA